MIRFAHSHGAPRFLVMLDFLMAHAKGPGDSALLDLFERNSEDLFEHYEGCVPALDGSDYWKWSPAICKLAEFHGPMFHSGFRKYDVVRSKGGALIDMEFWRLLGGGMFAADPPALTSESFWLAHDHSMQTAGRSAP